MSEPLMARPTIIDDGFILKTARDAFLEMGFSVTTAEIAKRAGISEGSIFKRFPTKADLFSAALEIPKILPWREMVQSHFDNPDVRHALLEIATVLLRFYREQLPVMLKLHAHLSQVIHIHQDVPAPPLQALATITEFFRRQTVLENIKTDHPETTARMFLGSMVNYAFFEMVFQDNQTPPETYVQQVVDTLWNGIKGEKA